MNTETAYTSGSWSTETDSAAVLDTLLASVELWNVYREVTGTLSQPRPSQLERAVRIDRILIPNERLISLGWTHGIVGVEIKRSGVKIGPPIAQAVDYSRTVWTLPPAGIKVWLDWVFIWPMAQQHSTVASILAQNRIGCAYIDRWVRLHLKSGEQNIIKIKHDGHISIGDATNGRKVGSR